jgi:hypothetical protein
MAPGTVRVRAKPVHEARARVFCVCICILLSGNWNGDGGGHTRVDDDEGASGGGLRRGGGVEGWRSTGRGGDYMLHKGSEARSEARGAKSKGSALARTCDIGAQLNRI